MTERPNFLKRAIESFTERNERAPQRVLPATALFAHLVGLRERDPNSRKTWLLQNTALVVAEAVDIPFVFLPRLGFHLIRVGMEDIYGATIGSLLKGS